MLTEPLQCPTFNPHIAEVNCLIFSVGVGKTVFLPTHLPTLIGYCAAILSPDALVCVPTLHVITFNARLLAGAYQ